MNQKNKSENISCLFQIIGIPIGGIIFWYLMKGIYSWVPNLAELLEYIQTPLRNSYKWKIIGLIISLIFAIGLYQIKKRIIIIYGFIEIAGGGWTIWATFSQNFENTILYALAIGGGIFLLVNGFENFTKYEKEVNKNK